MLAAAGLSVFTNGTVADAAAVNSNFAGLDSRVTTLETPAQGTVANVAMVQTRAQGSYAAPVSGNGTEITPLRLSLTPKKAGNRVILEWVVNGELHWDSTYIVTRNGVLLGEATNVNNNRWAGIAVPNYDNNVDSTPSNTTVKIIDMNTLGTATDYELRVRSGSGTAYELRLNRTWSSTGQDVFETGLSVGTATEIWW